MLRLASLAARAIQNGSKPKMRSAEVHFLRLPRGRSIAGAVVGGAQIGAALDNAAWRLTAGQCEPHSQGEKPAEPAVTESIDFEAAINLQTARALGVKVSPGVLYIADDVIEWTFSCSP